MTIAKIVHLTSVHPLRDPRILYKECRSLATAGYDVALVVPHDRDEVLEGVRICSVPKPRNRAERMSRTALAVYQRALRENGDLYHFHDPELLPIATLLKLGGHRVIYDMHEDLPAQVLSKPWIPHLLRSPLSGITRGIELMCGQMFDGIVSVSERVARRIVGGKVAIIHNYPSLHELGHTNSRPYEERPMHVAYVGAISTARGAAEMVESIGRLSPELGARLVLAGPLSTDLESALTKMSGWSRVNWHGWVGRKEVHELLSQSRIGLCVLHPEPHYKSEAFATKLFEYFAAGLPAIVSDFSAWKAAWADVGCVLFVNPLDVPAISAAVEWLLTHPREAAEMGRKGREAIETNFNWELEREVLFKLYRDILPPQLHPLPPRTVGPVDGDVVS